jgi:hypothetical protein
LHFQAVVKAVDIDEYDRLVMHVLLFVFEHFGDLVERAETAGEHRYGIGAGEQCRAALGPTFGDDHFVGVRAGFGFDRLDRDADDPAAGLLRSVGDRFHRAVIGPAPDEGMPAAGDEPREFSGRHRISFPNVLHRAEDGDVHAPVSFIDAAGLVFTTKV